MGTTTKANNTTSTATPDNQGEGPDKDDVFHLLSNRRRRYALHYLLQQGERATKRDIARQIAAWENGIPVEEVTPDMRKRVYIALHQTHLPKMEDGGLLKSDDRSNVVTITDDAERLRVYVDIVEDKELPWSNFYLGLGVISCVVVTLSVFEVSPFEMVPPLGWATAIAALFMMTSLVHTIQSRQYQIGSEGPPPELREERLVGRNERDVARQFRSWITGRGDNGDPS